MDVPSRRKKGLRSSKNYGRKCKVKKSKPRLGLPTRNSENSIFQCFVARPMLVTFCNVLLFGITLWVSVSDKGTYNHIALESVSKLESATRRGLRSESPASTISSNPISSSQATVAISTTTSDKEQQEQTKSKAAEATPTPNQSSTRVDTISPIPCSEQLANRKSDQKDPNRDLEESPYKHVTKIEPNMYVSLHAAEFDAMRWTSIYNQGNYYERGITRQFSRILGNTDKPGLVIDVGMNIGWFTLFSRAMGHKVVGFDPNPIMHTRLCESLKLNGWLEDSSVKSFAYGLGSEPAMLEFTTGRNPGMGSFFEDRMAKKVRKKQTVPVVKLDDVADQQGWITDLATPIHLWKMDVEGYEYHVWEGAQKLLKSRRVRNILLENSSDNLQQIVKMYLSIYKAGYDIKVLSGVHGNPTRSNTIPDIHKLFDEASLENMESLYDKPLILDFKRLTLNIWWELREETS